jgi:DNA polymerase-3 subunit alpha
VGGFVHLHNHTEYSALDGLSTCAEAVEQAAADGHPALAITDHGVCSGHPEHQRACLAAGLNPIFGIEAYWRPNRLIRPGDPGVTATRADLERGKHLILLAKNDKGLHDLWAASTEANATGFYGRPRFDWELLERYGSDLIATSSCLGGVISGRLREGFRSRQLDGVLADIDRFKATFPGRFYLEIQANDLPDQIQLNLLLEQVSKALKIPLVAAADAHYPSEDQEALHKIWMRCQSGKGKDDYWHFSAMLTGARVREILLGHGLEPASVDAAIRNTSLIAEQCTARISGYAAPPVFTPGGRASDDARHLMDLCRQNWHKVPDTQVYRDRLEREFGLVSDKRLAGCYLIVADIVNWVLAQNILVGPGRGSAAGSLMSYLTGITSIDPIPAGLLFERFLTPGREALPDFDLDFPSSKREMIQGRVIGKYGADSVVRVGTHMRYGARGILNKLFSVLEDALPAEAQGDAVQISHLIEEAEAGTAGLGLPWDEIVADQAITEYVERYGSIFRLAAKLQGRLYSYGKHPAGLIISPGQSLRGTMPMKVSDTSNKDLLVSEFDYRAAEERGLLKLDLLTVRTLDTAQLACELIAKRTGTMPDPRSWNVEHGDPQVYEAIGKGATLGMFQFETSLCTSYARQISPRTLSELSDLTTIIRPGPSNSGAADAYVRRGQGTEDPEPPHPALAEHLKRSRGLLLYQEDILMACRVLAGYNDLEADGVRKILGKKLLDKIAAAGEEFTRRCVERGHDREQIEALWDKMAEFGKYAFNRAHGYSYGTLSYWTAWLKVHYPVEFLTAVLSTLTDKDRMADFAMEARRLGIQVLPPDVRTAGGEFTYEGLTIRYGLKSVKHVGVAAIFKIVASQPYTTLDDFRARSGVDIGILNHLARAGALDGLVVSRRGLLQVVGAQRDGSAVRCIHKAEPGTGPGGLPCSFAWSAEPLPPPRFHKTTRRPLKVIPLAVPARCTVSCRHYTPPEMVDMDQVPEYTPAELFRMDDDTYGCWMAQAPFEQLNKLGPGMRGQAREMALMVLGAPAGTYPMAAVYGGYRKAYTRTGNAMWRVRLVTEVSSLSMACFTPRRDDEPDVPLILPTLRIGTLVSAQVIKRSYTVPGRGPRMGWNIHDLWAVR